MIKDPHEIILSSHDAAALHELLRARRTARLCHPDDARGELDCLSVLSPSGIALLGRRPGSLVMSALPNGWPFSVRVIDVHSPEKMELI